MDDFSLTKWYLDCVDDAGEVSIAYWARLAWKAVSLTYSSLLTSGHTREHILPLAPPSVDAEGVSWTAKPLGATISIRRRLGPVAHTLLDNQLGSILWRCEVPAGSATLTVDGGKSTRGSGYAEILRMSVAPWALPIDELRWGRFASEQSSLVWIDWRGKEPKTLVLQDGCCYENGTITDREVTIETGTSLSMRDPRSIRDSTLGGVVSKIPILHHMLPSRIALARERKWCSRASLKNNEKTEEGFAIHELVSFT